MLIGVIASGFQVPAAELRLGVARIEGDGHQVRVHPGVRKRHFFFAGDDTQRLQQWIDFAWDDEIDAIWCARGGHGALRLLPLLITESIKRGPPRKKKVLLGYSDTTLFFDFVQRHWGWRVIHAPMPGGREFLEVDSSQWVRLMRWLEGGDGQPKHGYRLKPLNSLAREVSRLGTETRGRISGGNLTVLTCGLGTSFQPQFRESLLFLEDTGELWFRVDRMMAQLFAANALSGVSGLILGTWSGCRDATSTVLDPRVARKGRDVKMEKSIPKKFLRPLRGLISDRKALQFIFSDWSEKMGGVPVWHGLPVGHGGGLEALPIGAMATVAKDRLWIQPERRTER